MLTLGDDVEKGLLDPVVIRTKQEKPKQIFRERTSCCCCCCCCGSQKSFTRSCKKKGELKMNRSEICSKIEVITISIDMSIDKRSSSLSPLFFSAFFLLFVFFFFPISYPATFCCLDEIEIGAISSLTRAR